MSLGMLSIAFFGNHPASSYQDSQSKVSIKVSYANDTSNAYQIITQSNQKYTISQQYSWADDNFTRFNLQSYSIDGDSFVSIPRESSGNFTLEIETNSSHAVIFLAKPQLKIITSGTDKINFSPPSPTNDNWFDAGSDVQFIAPHVIQSSQEDTRQQLSGWSSDISYINIISRQESGDYKSPVIHMSSTQKIDLKYTTQYYIKVISNFGRALGTGWYDSGTIINLSVIPGDDILVSHVFTGWQGSVIGSGNQESVNVFSDSPKTIVANWIIDYTNVSIISIIVIAVLVSFTVYQKRRGS
ncbi:MAG: hypothetical protein KGI28_03450 [Thaumarchaeota archaeon]|nr:hypothetical protein [Nitrososphaerota archaeon]